MLSPLLRNIGRGAEAEPRCIAGRAFPGEDWCPPRAYPGLRGQEEGELVNEMAGVSRPTLREVGLLYDQHLGVQHPEGQ